MFKVNQTVWCAIYGKGVIESIGQEAEETYPITVKFSDNFRASYTNDGKYHVLGNVVLFPHPVEIVKAVTKPSIDWSHVSESFKYLVQDEDGGCWLTKDRPTATPISWAGGDTVRNASHFASLVPGTCDWKDSLVERPEGLCYAN